LFQALKATTFRSLRHRSYRRYFYGQVVSFVGTWMQSAALMWLMYDRTGDPRWPSWILVAQIGPTLLLGAWGGSLADRFPKRRLILTTQAAFLLNALALTAVVGSGFATPPLVLALVALNGAIQAVDFPARLAFVPDLVPKELARLQLGPRARPGAGGPAVPPRGRAGPAPAGRGERGDRGGDRVLRAERAELRRGAVRAARHPRRGGAREARPRVRVGRGALLA
jgi:MFS family permease